VSHHHVHPFRRLLVVACFLSLASLGLMVWSMVDPVPIPVIVAMSAGQVVGTISFAIFGYVVVVDLRLKRRIDRVRTKEETDEHA
jgi:hypothetical protein